jgi:hypothetical protein
MLIPEGVLLRSAAGSFAKGSIWMFGLNIADQSGADNVEG